MSRRRLGVRVMSRLLASDRAGQRPVVRVVVNDAVKRTHNLRNPGGDRSSERFDEPTIPIHEMFGGLGRRQFG